MNAKPLSIIRATAIVALARSLTRLLARSLTHPLPRAPAMSALSSASRGLFLVSRRSLHEIRVRFSVGFGTHEAEDATVLDAAAELRARPAPPPPSGCPSPGMLVLRLKTATAVPASSSCAVHESLLENFEKLE